MEEASAHCQGLLLDVRGPTLKDLGHPLFWNRVLGGVLAESHFVFATFDEITRQINDLTCLHARLQNQIKPGTSLPSDLFGAYQEFRFLLEAAQVDITRTLQVGFFPSPPLQQFCSREP
jgi:hypothetical protein